MLWVASTLYKQSETLQGENLHDFECLCKVLAVNLMVWCSHMWWQEALCIVLVQITSKSNSLNVVVCINHFQII
jgi:hypothetical protein